MFKLNLPDFSFLKEFDSMNLTMVLLSVCIGIAIASCAMLYRQVFLGNIARNIIKKGALSDEKALTLEELGYKKNSYLTKFALRKNSTFRKLVLSTEDGKYYIPEDKKDYVEIRYRKKGTTPFGVVFGVIAMLIVAFLCLTLIPMFADEINKML